MGNYRISEVAEQTGLSPSALRYYEQIGLIGAPERTESGYRRYDDHTVEQLRFISRSKRLGLSLVEIANLVVLLDEQECAPMQAHLRDVLGARQRAVAEQIADLDDFQRQLAGVTALLDDRPVSGRCDDACGCFVEVAGDGAAAITCDLDPAEMPARLARWRRLAAHVTERTNTIDGVRVRIDRDVPTAEIADLAAREQECCSFFAFTIRIGADGTTLDVRAPEDARRFVDMLFETG